MLTWMLQNWLNNNTQISHIIDLLEKPDQDKVVQKLDLIHSCMKQNEIWVENKRHSNTHDWKLT